ncbi:MAG TPA: hypothetical protein VK929_00040 [Longimicrobiales bacterium]|nr:hypothetical protein [Longimicrobiales bacterium]
MSILASLILQDDGLTFVEVLQNIPHDGPAVVIYLMLAGFVALVWLGSRATEGVNSQHPPGPDREN